MDLVGGLVSDMRELFSAHVTAARLEMKEEAAHIVQGLKNAVAAAMLGGVGAILLGFALAMGLVALGLPAWAAHGIVGGVAAATALGFWLRVKNQVTHDGVPEREIERAAHDARWIAKRARAAAQGTERNDAH